MFCASCAWNCAAKASALSARSLARLRFAVSSATRCFALSGHSSFFAAGFSSSSDSASSVFSSVLVSVSGSVSVSLSRFPLASLQLPILAGQWYDHLQRLLFQARPQKTLLLLCFRLLLRSLNYRLGLFGCVRNRRFNLNAHERTSRDNDTV